MRPLGFVLVLFCGCQSGFQRDTMEYRLDDDYTNGAILDDNGEDLQTATYRGTLPELPTNLRDSRNNKVKVRPSVQFPCRIAIHINEYRSNKWTKEDRTTLEFWGEQLIRDGYASSVFMLPRMLIGDGSAREVRSGALKAGADLLLVIQADYDVDDYVNPASALYPTLVGLFIAPGNNRDVLYMMEGCLIDPRTGHVWAGASAEGEGQVIRPKVFIEGAEHKAITQARSQAVTNFASEMNRQIAMLAERHKNTAVPELIPAEAQK